MIKFETRRGYTEYNIEGTVPELMADLSIGTGRVLQDILEDFEGQERTDLIKQFFEHILMVMEDASHESDCD